MTPDPEILACDLVGTYPSTADAVHATLRAYRHGYLTPVEATEDLNLIAALERIKQDA